MPRAAPGCRRALWQRPSARCLVSSFVPRGSSRRSRHADVCAAGNRDRQHRAARSLPVSISAPGVSLRGRGAAGPSRGDYNDAAWSVSTLFRRSAKMSVAQRCRRSSPPQRMRQMKGTGLLGDAAVWCTGRVLPADDSRPVSSATPLSAMTAMSPSRSLGSSASTLLRGSATPVRP